MSKVINHIKLSETLALTECSDGYWLYDETRGMNLAMKAKTANDAFTEALTYYQKRLQEVEQKHKELASKVDAFVSQFIEEDPEENY